MRTLKSATEVKNVLNYILKNGIKHKRTKSVLDPYNSALAFHDFKILGVKVIWADNLMKEKERLKPNTGSFERNAELITNGSLELIKCEINSYSYDRIVKHL